jgi:hypothetical protein
MTTFPRNRGIVSGALLIHSIPSGKCGARTVPAKRLGIVIVLSSFVTILTVKS